MLLCTAGWLWLAAGVRRSSDPLAFTLGVSLTLMYQPPLLHLALSFPLGVLRTRMEKAAVGFFFGSWLVATVLGWAFFDPRLHVSVGQSTSRNLLLLWDSPELMTTLGNAIRTFQIAVGAAIVVVLVGRWRAGTKAYRSSFLPLWLAVIVKTAATVWVSLAVIQLSGSLSTEALLWQYPATAIVPLAVLFGLWRYRFARGTLGDLMVEVGSAPMSDRLVAALRRSVHDPSLTLLRWVPDQASFVDGGGVPQPLPETSSGRASMVLERHGTPVGAWFLTAPSGTSRNCLQPSVARLPWHWKTSRWNNSSGTSSLRSVGPGSGLSRRATPGVVSLNGIFMTEPSNDWWRCPWSSRGPNARQILTK